MGITVPLATLPSGIQLSNVYISFANEPVSIVPASINNFNPLTDNNWKYQVNSYYSVFKDRLSAKTTRGSNLIRIPIGVRLQIYPTNPHQVIYNKLKEIFPSSIDSFEFSQNIPPSNLVVSNDTLVSLYKNLNLDSNTYIIPEGTSNLVFTHGMFFELSNVINQFSFTVVETSNTVSVVETSNTASVVETSNTASVVETSNTASVVETSNTASVVETSN